MHRPAGDVVVLHFCDERLNVVAHEVELLDVVLVGRMDGNFRGRQSKDQPALTYIDFGKFEDVAQESAIGIGILTIDDRMCADDHVRISSWATANSTTSPSTLVPSMVNRATVIGSLNRRGPALPGLTKRTPSRLSI